MQTWLQKWAQKWVQEWATIRSIGLGTIAIAVAIFGLTVRPELALADDPPVPPPPASDTAPPPPPPPPAADPTTQHADALSDEAKAAYKDKKYAAAFALFEKAFATQPRSAFLYNMAKCREKLAEYGEAVKQLERYLEVYRQQNDGLESPDRADTLRQIEDLKRRAFEALPEVSIQSVPPGAQVLEAGVTIGSTPLVTRMRAGRHPIVLKLAKHSDLDAELEVPQSGKVSVVWSMKSTVKRGAIGVWCNVRGAQIAIDGKVAAVTPFAGQLDVEPGAHQVTITRVDYQTGDIQINVADDRLVKLRLSLRRINSVSTYRSALGWPLAVLGAIGLAGGGALWYLANQQYRGTPTFEQYVGFQDLGYTAGGTALGLGLVLIGWDGLREGIPTEELVDGPALGHGIEVVPLGGLDVERK
ncbi:MAG: PEGA domain-containing protein [Myxococcales bacterium]|nr:PEGA domain-containing protein [Myxococcales bacterium]